MRGLLLLLLHGPPGVGKTHLLKLILRLVRAWQGSAPIVHTSAAELVQELTAAIRREQPAAIRHKYAQAELVAVDDLHVLAGKPATQSEIAALLKAALDSGARLACTAGCPPAEIPELSAALRALPTARLVELRRPNDEEMRQILAAMAPAEGLKLSAKTIAAIAPRCGGDVRRAVGALAQFRFEQSRDPQAGLDLDGP